MRRSSRKGFTLIELMVVIGIILLLVSIVVFGLRHVNASAARHETVAEMNICEGMLKEYQSINGMTNIEDFAAQPAPVKLTIPLGPTPGDAMDVPLPVYVNNQTPIAGPPPSFLKGDDLSASASGDFGDRGGSKTPRYISPAVVRTKAVMYIVLKDPKNHTALEAVPAKRILEGPPDNSGSSTLVPSDYSMVLDGWGNPIIYVPRGGLVVWMSPGQPSYFLVRSSGTYIATDSQASGGNFPHVGQTDRPFFASAGQDGIFSDLQAKTDYGIDNIYSFQK